MAGRYLQLGIIFAIIFQIPGLVVLSFYMYETIIWFGFDEETAIISQHYMYSIILGKLVYNVDLCLTEFLDVIDRELYVTIYCVVTQCFTTGILAAIAYSGVTSMVSIGLAETAVYVTTLLVNFIIIMNKGWLDDYEEGLFKTSGLKVSEILQCLLMDISQDLKPNLLLRLQKHKNTGLASGSNNFCYGHASRYSLVSYDGRSKFNEILRFLLLRQIFNLIWF